jgi:PhnB protein
LASEFGLDYSNQNSKAMSFKAVDEVKPIPVGYHTITPFLTVDDAAAYIDFIEQAFGGDVTYMMKQEDGVIRHATVKIGDSLVMISNANKQYSPMPCMLHMYVEDVDSSYNKAVRAGCITIEEPRDQFYGDRGGGVKDPWGNQWWLATHIEDVSDEEIVRREKQLREQRT